MVNRSAAVRQNRQGCKVVRIDQIDQSQNFALTVVIIDKSVFKCLCEAQLRAREMETLLEADGCD